MEIEMLEVEGIGCPVQEFLEDLDDKTKKKILRTLELFESYEDRSAYPYDIFRKMEGQEKYRLYEFRIFYNKSKYRILCTYHLSTCYLVHAFKKTTQKTPIKEINKAIQRIENYLPRLHETQ